MVDTLEREPITDDTPHDDGPSLTDELVIPGAQIQDVRVGRKANGATYVATFEVPLEYLQAIGDAGDGHSVFFKGKEVGQGADIRSLGLKKDVDNNRHVKFNLQFAQSEIAKSLGRLGGYITHDSEGELRLVPEQQSLQLTTRAE